MLESGKYRWIAAVALLVVAVGVWVLQQGCVPLVESSDPVEGDPVGAPAKFVPADGMTGSETTTVERFASLEAPDEVQADAAFAVLFSLTTEQLAPGSDLAGPEDGTGRLRMSLPPAPRRGAWDLDVVLSAPGCTVAEGRNVRRIVLPRSGDSTPARFDLVARPVPRGGTRATRLHATLWHAGTYLARVSRSLTIRSASLPAAEPAEAGISVARRCTLDLAVEPPDLTVYLRTDEPGRAQVILASRLFQTPTFADWSTDGIAAWIEDRLLRLATGLRRGRAIGQGTRPGGADLIGLGRDLFERCSPPRFRRLFWELADRLGAEFDSIAVFSDDPRIPWELMRPRRADGTEERGFLGTEFRIGRWHLSAVTPGRERPPQAFALRRLAVVAPRYAGVDRLPGQRRELGVLQELPGYRAVPGTRAGLGELLREAVPGIVHFAGHGTVVDAPGGAPTFAIRLEDGELDLTAWSGLSPARYPDHPFVFLNACEVGQARRTADFVDGWAPLVLELGAVGCIGALCPVDDAGAADFAAEFYGRLASRLETGPARVGEVLRASRRARLEAGDPTGLGYVYYGDPELRVLPGS